MTVCFGALTCVGIFEMVIVTVFTIGAVLYVSNRREQPYLFTLAFAAVSLLAYPASYAVVGFVGITTYSITAGLVAVIVLFGSVSFIAYRYSQANPSSFVSFVCAFFGGATVGWLVSILSFLLLRAVSML